MKNNLEFRGHWTNILGATLVIFFLTVITLGIYAPWGYARFRRIVLNLTYYREQPLQFDGTGGQVFRLYLAIVFFSFITLGLYAFLGFAQLRMLRWDSDHTILPDGRRLEYRGSALDLLAQYLLIGLLSTLTLGIYYFWGYARLRRHIISNTYIQGLEQPLQFYGTGSQFLGIGLVNALLTIITLGLYAFLGFAAVRLIKWDVDNTALPA
jgi:uncharacterized membrane protein YjgN (DUF898 family)